MRHRKLVRVFRSALLAAAPVSLGALVLGGCGGETRTCPTFDGGTPACVASWEVPASASCLHLGDGGPGSWPVPAAVCTKICGPQRSNCWAARDDALAWRVARWSGSRLDATARRRVAQARRAAVDTIERQCCAPVDPELIANAGMPDRRQTRTLFDALRDGVWSA